MRWVMKETKPKENKKEIKALETQFITWVLNLSKKFSNSTKVKEIKSSSETSMY